DAALLCAGWRGRLSLEDMLCAGNILYELFDGTLPPDTSDSVKIAFVIYEKFSDDIESMIQQSSHARRLQDIINTDDITFSCQKNTTDVLPILNDGMITNHNGKET